MKIILLGAPGAGKGTQAELISKEMAIPAISTGNMLREAIRNRTEVGQQVEAVMERGELVPDQLIIQLVKERVSQEDCRNGYILDGVPRTVPQAEALERAGIAFDDVISIEIEDPVIEDRMSGRRVCASCGSSYHVHSNPPRQEGICDNCGGNLIIRPDDEVETVRNRLRVFHEETEVLKHYYDEHHTLKMVDGSQSIADTHKAIMAAIGESI